MASRALQTSRAGSRPSSSPVARQWAGLELIKPPRELRETIDVRSAVDRRSSRSNSSLPAVNRAQPQRVLEFARADNIRTCAVDGVRDAGVEGDA
jgi:hypothetical protein